MHAWRTPWGRPWERCSCVVPSVPRYKFKLKDCLGAAVLTPPANSGVELEAPVAVVAACRRQLGGSSPARFATALGVSPRLPPDRSILLQTAVASDAPLAATGARLAGSSTYMQLFKQRLTVIDESNRAWPVQVSGWEGGWGGDVHG